MLPEDEIGLRQTGVHNGTADTTSDLALPTMPAPCAMQERIASLEGRLQQVMDVVVEVRDLLTAQRTIRDYYTTEQVAKILGKANWTVREWCRLGRVHALKRHSGRGRAKDWTISHAELQRIEKEGLVPVPGPKYRG